MNNPMDRLNLEGMGPELRVALDALKENRDLMIEFNTIQAEITFAKYTSLVKAGFSDEQALQLCSVPLA